jgi:ubiquinone/menaquinone biosynthesis C-methylase UbiE
VTEDIWARWLTYRRQGGSTLSPELEKQLHGLRDRVLALASIKDGDTVLDVGCGDGLIGFGALDRVGPPGHVIFSDISADLLGRCKATAEGIGAADRCRFLLAPADDLRDVPTASVDVVTTRSVLIYVSAKSRALAEFFRVLKASGRAAIAEPINRYCFPEPAGTLFGYDVRPIANLAARIADRYDQVETPQIAAMLDFDERDLVTMAERAGFAEIHLDLRIDIEASGPVDWTTFARQAGNPLSPTLEEAMESVLSPSEREQVTAYLKPLVESGAGTTRSAFAFMSALKQ